jgi:hypothetical protein
MLSPPEPPGYQRAAHHSLRHSLGTTVLALLAVVNAVLFLAAVSKALNANGLSPALRAGLGFFGCMALACIAGYWWLVRHAPTVQDLIVGERIVATRMHRDAPVFRASHCLYFAGVREAVEFRRALAGLVVGTHVFYLDDGAYLTAAGISHTVGRHESRSSIVFMRAFQEYFLRRESSPL